MKRIHLTQIVISRADSKPVKFAVFDEDIRRFEEREDRRDPRVKCLVYVTRNDYHEQLVYVAESYDTIRRKLNYTPKRKGKVAVDIETTGVEGLSPKGQFIASQYLHAGRGVDEIANDPEKLQTVAELIAKVFHHPQNVEKVAKEVCTNDAVGT